MSSPAAPDAPTQQLTDQLRKDVERLSRDYEELRRELRSRLGDSSPTHRRGVLAQAGATAEMVCKFVYRREGADKNRKPIDDAMLDELIGGLEKQKLVPRAVGIDLRTIQAWRNHGAHDTGDGGETAGDGTERVMAALTAVILWFFQDYLGGEFAGLAAPLEVAAEREAPLDQWRELHAWLMRGGSLKKLDEMALEALRLKLGLAASQVDEVRAAHARDVDTFREVVTDAVDDGVLEAHESEALELVRVTACISRREATEILSSLAPNVRFDAATAPDWIQQIAGAAQAVAQPQVQAEAQTSATVQATVVNARPRGAAEPVATIAPPSRPAIEAVAVPLAVEAGGTSSERSAGGPELIVAAAAGNLDEVNGLLEAGVPVDYRRDDGSTALLLAASAALVEVVAALVSRGADPNAANEYGATPLLATFVERDEDENAEQISARTLACARLLVAAGGRVPASNSLQLTPLHVAAGVGDVERVKAALTAGVGPNATNSFGLHALGYACVSKPINPDVVSLLLRAGADPNLTVTTQTAQGKLIFSPLMVAILSLGPLPEDDEARALRDAAKAPTAQVLRHLLKAGATADVMNMGA